MQHQTNKVKEFFVKINQSIPYIGVKGVTGVIFAKEEKKDKIRKNCYGVFFTFNGATGSPC